MDLVQEIQDDVEAILWKQNERIKSIRVDVFFLETPMLVNKSCLVRLARMLPPLYHAVR